MPKKACRRYENFTIKKHTFLETFLERKIYLILWSRLFFLLLLLNPCNHPMIAEIYQNPPMGFTV